MHRLAARLHHCRITNGIGALYGGVLCNLPLLLLLLVLMMLHWASDGRLSYSCASTCSTLLFSRLLS